MTVLIRHSSSQQKKYTAQLINEDGYITKSVSFGAKGMSDFTIHKDAARRMRYLKRMGGVYPSGKEQNANYQPVTSKTQDWKKSGYDTAGFWSRWLLWNLPSLSGSAKDIEKRFGLKIVFELE